MHDVQPADAPGPNVPNLPIYVSLDRDTRQRDLHAREAALWADQSVLGGLSPASQAAAVEFYNRNMDAGQTRGLSAVADQLFSSPPP